MQKQINFFKLDKLFYFLSTAAMLFSVYTIFYGNSFKYGTDFTGGVEATIDFKKKTSVKEVIGFFNKKAMDVEVEKVLSKENRYILRTSIKQESGKTEKAFMKVLKAFSKQKGNEMTVVQNRTVGSVVSGENKANAFKIVLAAILVIVVYISIRFKWAYALAAILAVTHDVTLMLGFISYFQLEFNVLTIIAILTIFGYSVNDTIVLFDRVRETKKEKGAEFDYRKILNVSINSVLVRTLITSLTTILVVATMYFYTEGTLKQFALQLIVGLFVGTYSSVYVSCGFMLFCSSRKIKV